jgi:DNA polymerase II large subunit
MVNVDIQKYFESMETEVARAYDLANRARKNGFDPEPRVDIPLAKNIFERVEGLIGSVKPELIGSGLAKRLEELDKQYGSGDWRVGLIITEEVARRKFCQFEDDREAMEVGIRVGLAYLTMGVVAAPLEGFIELKIKDRADGEKYASAFFAGPIRAAGATAAAVTLILTDYIRRKFDIRAFDITEEEIARNISECDDYHEKVARLQYYPNAEELTFLLKRIPIEINGDPTSEREVLVHKNLPRIGTPRIRGGMCLVLCEGLAGKAVKILKNVKKWGKEFGLDEWTFLSEYIDIKTRVHAGSENKDELNSDIKIKPNTVFIEETVAGRPIFSYPMTKGGFRIRYGRSRVSGLAACSFHPATTRILGNFIATGAQLRMERPGKACAATPCTSIDGPVVKLMDESVLQINTEEDAIKYKNQVKEILSLGDILIPFGEFARNNHILVPSPYVEEWWIQELHKAAGPDFKELKNFDAQQLVDLSEKYSIPLHPSLLSLYADVSSEDLIYLMEILSKSTVSKNENGVEILIPHDKLTKKILEDLCTFHKLVETGILIQNEQAIGLLCAFGFYPGQKWEIEKAKQLLKEKKKPLEVLNSLSKFKIMNKSGIYLGARLGRPEKAKQRKLKGNPHILFPVGSEGGRMRSLNEALVKGCVEASVPVFECIKCKARNIYPKCNKCGSETKAIRFCQKCGKETNSDMHCGTKTAEHHRGSIDVRMMLDSALKNLNITLPPLIKGVRGTSNKRKIPEPLEKGILRAIHDVYVNKDGTIRYDIIETPITHFKPKEIGTSIEQLKKLGYTTDMLGKPIENDNQVIEILAQDVILPDCKEWQDASALVSIEKICSFIDDLLVRYYHEEPYYNIRSPSDMVGQLIIGLAPHTSAGIIGRIIGFSKTQCFFAHPYFHSACRRNCDGDELCFLMLMDALLNFSRQYLPDKRGGRSMDAPLVLTTRLEPQEVDDEVYNMDIADMYPLEFYQATLEWKSPSDVKIRQVQSTLGKPEQYQGFFYTHPTENINAGNRISAYKTLVTVFDKVNEQMALAEKTRAVNKGDVARIIIEKHFLKDIKGNLRKFSRNEFRCVSCNERYRRIPLAGRCLKCSGKLIFTVAEGTVSKYLEPSMSLAEKYSLPSYLKQSLEVLKRAVDSVFGKEATKQVGLKGFLK